jgi:HAMP domain-containing protein
MSRKFHVDLRFKLLIPLLALITAIFTAGYFTARYYLKTTIDGTLKTEADAIIEFTASCMDEDELEALTSGTAQYNETAGWPQGMTDPRYWRQQHCLEEVNHFNPRAQIFTYYPLDANTLAYGLDQWATLKPKDSYILGDKVSQDTDYWTLLLGLKDVYYFDEVRYAPEDGVYYYLANAPLKNSAGKVIGGISIYIDANDVVQNLKVLSNMLLEAFVLIAALISLLVLGIMKYLTSPLTDLQTAAARLANGDYTPISLESQVVDDEVSTLTAAFNLMLDKVRGREESLKQEVVELKFQIDEERRKQEVKEIQETEFFQDLKSRAAEVRKKREGQ